MITINITPQVLLRLKDEGFYADEMFSLYFVLKALDANDVELLDDYDDFNTAKRAILTYQTLYRKGFIEKSKEGSSVFYQITNAGRDFIKELEPKKEAEELDEWINEWLQIFPEKNQNGILRSELVDVVPRMRAFIKKYKYPKEVIIPATKSYIMQESAKEFQYTKRAMYFIDKRGEGSLLASWCKSVIDNKTSDGKYADGTRTKLIQTVN